MRAVEIHVSNSDFIPGERIEGSVIVNCDEGFDCNRVFIELIGEEETRVTVGSGDDRRTYSDTVHHLHMELELDSEAHIYEGRTEFDFSFKLPRILPPTYNGMHGWVKYWLHAKAEVSWALDPKAKQDIYIPFAWPDKPPEELPVHVVSEKDEMWSLKVEMPTDLLILGEKFDFRTIVASGVKLRKLRAYLYHVEFVWPDGRDTEHWELLNSVEIPEEELIRDTWFDLWYDTDPAWNPPISSELMRTEYWLDVTLDIPWRGDFVLKIPIKVWSR
ncbi:MAG: sporulation protein [Candidatus Thorarchaeota archaeon]|jgi:hypothetical protein